MVRVPRSLPAITGLVTIAIVSGFRAPSRVEGSRASAQSELVIHKEGTTEYHRPWCSIVRDGTGVLALTRAQATARELKSHADCEKEPPSGTVATSGRLPAPRSQPAPAVFVFVDGTKYYHREKCLKSAGATRRVTLEVAGKTRWPCPACRPPVRKKGDASAIPHRVGRG